MDASKVIDRIVSDLEENCKSQGHFWAESPLFHGEYCQACGATRAASKSASRSSVAEKE